MECEQELQDNTPFKQVNILSVIKEEDISAQDLIWESNVDKALSDISNTDLKSRISISNGNTEQKVDLEFDNFTWNSDPNNPDNVVTNFKEKGLEIDRKLSPNKRSCPTEIDGEIDGLVQKPKHFAKNEIAFGLINMPTDIPFEDIPSRYSRPIEDVLNMTDEERIEFAERRRREEEKRHDENLLAARHGRLHPDNARFNQGPVINPPQICPRTMVAFTPGGQRYEVDLSVGRPTYFRSEYNRMQYDDATITNHKKMMGSIQDGSFLPKTLNDDIERRHIAEKKFVEKMIEDLVQNLSESEEEIVIDGDVENVKHSKTERKEEIVINHVSENVMVSKTETLKTDNGEDDNGHDDSCFDSEDDISLSDSEQMLFLDMELTLLKFHHDVTVIFRDRPSECVVQLQKIIDLNLHPIMFKKNPQLLGLAKRVYYFKSLCPFCVAFFQLMEQREFPELQIAAQYFYNKIKSLFDVPHGVHFEDFFQSEVKAFRERFFSSESNSILAMLLSFRFGEDANQNIPSTSGSNNVSVETRRENVHDFDEVDVENVADNIEEDEDEESLLSSDEGVHESDEEDEGAANIEFGYSGPNEE